MAATEKGVWDLQEVRDKQLASEWTYDGAQQLFTCGDNGAGGIGNNEGGPGATDFSSPVQVSGNTWSEVKYPNAGGRPLAIKTDGTIWTWGADSDGSLGLNDAIARSSPTQIGSGTDWTTIAASTNHGMARKSDNALWMWGYNNYGQLGLNKGGPSYQARSSPIQLPGDLSENISATPQRSAAVKTDGSLWAWGQNYGGVLGQNETFGPNKKGYSSPVQIPGSTWSTSKGHLHITSTIAAVKTDGTMWMMGQNGNGGLGLNNKTEYSSPMQVGTDTTWSWVMVFGGATAAVKTNGTLWSWGYNNMGMLGHNNQTEYSSPRQVGSGTDWSKVWLNETVGAALKTDGTAWMMGRNDQYGQQGHNNRTQYSSPKQVPGTYIWINPSNAQTGWIKQL